jgi:hypothetical protein
MKNLIIILMLAFSFSLFAQERTIEKTARNGFRDGTYYKYTGVAADTLISTNQDTIDFVIEYQGPGYVKKIALHTQLDTIDGADTTVSISVYGKEFEDDGTYVEIIAASTSSAVASTLHSVLTSDWTETFGTYNSTVAAHTLLTDTTGLSGYPADSVAVPSHIIANAAQTVTPLDKSYRFYRVRYIISGDDSVGDGILISEIEMKLYTE